MKKNMKSLIAGGVVLTTLTGMLALPSLATVGQKLLRADYHDMKVTLNGKTLNLTDSDGDPVEPFTIDGTTYLPLACISQALGVDVAWDGPNNTVMLTTEDKTAASGTNPSADDIGVEKAKSAALKHAGLSADKVTFLKAQLDYDDGVRVYDVEFWSGNKEYDYEIDAATGSVRSCDWDIEDYTPVSSSSDTLSKAQIKAIVEKKAGTTGTYRDFHLDRDDGRLVYEGELRSNGMEYEFEIDAVTGAILDWDADWD